MTVSTGVDGVTATRPIGLVAAMHQELAAVLERLPDEQRQRVAGRDFWLGHWHGHAVVAVLSGVGKVAAATTATVLAERFGVGAVVFTGTAGGLGPGVCVGDVVVADAFVQHDMDASPLFPRFELPGQGRSCLPCDERLSGLLLAAAQTALGDGAGTPRDAVHAGCSQAELCHGVGAQGVSGLRQHLRGSRSQRC